MLLGLMGSRLFPSSSMTGPPSLILTDLVCDCVGMEWDVRLELEQEIHDNHRGLLRRKRSRASGLSVPALFASLPPLRFSLDTGRSLVAAFVVIHLSLPRALLLLPLLLVVVRDEQATARRGRPAEAGRDVEGARQGGAGDACSPRSAPPQACRRAEHLARAHQAPCGPRDGMLLQLWLRGVGAE